MLRRMLLSLLFVLALVLVSVGSVSAQEMPMLGSTAWHRCSGSASAHGDDDAHAANGPVALNRWK